MIADYSIHKIFIVSAGRTGTKFFGENLQKIVPHSISTHEPDKISIFRTNELKTKIKRQGIIDLFILKSMGILGSRNLSLRYLNNSLSRNQAMKKILYERRWVKNTRFYFEANQQLYGLSNVLVNLSNSKVIVIFRDPREWVRSVINRSKTYTLNNILSNINMLGFKKINPGNLRIKNQNWAKLNQFQRTCWTWNFLNTHFFDSLARNDNITHFFFEDIFIKKDREKIRDFFCFSLENYFNEKYVEEFISLLKNKVNVNPTNDFPSWLNWDRKYRQALHFFCGDLMKKLGYGNEPEWENSL